MKRWVGEGSYRDIEAEIRRLLVAASPGTTLPPISPEAMAFAKTGEPSYAGITGETYLGAERREPGAVTPGGSLAELTDSTSSSRTWHGQDHPSLHGR